MAKSLQDTELDKLIQAWLLDHGVNLNDVRSYEFTKTAGDLPMLRVSFFYQEKPASAGDQE
jgi:hypothetical protein